ncbi:YqaJ viral recombinase family protein (plasmid) [Shewanella xiamenensis]|jgi:putative phage-type endonuclease|uniref:YqaJ viral recombinase family protein n=2 Tax=Shewanella TaxID=22 RepID=A0AAE4Q4Y6_9GAMM|nr:MULTISPECIES: YqaJ viral recombinase family protein [Shewanella]MCK7657721.1 YqaJ viral recombinase family protein [Shewanella sp. JNE4-2]MCT8858061.1 YqaJ viral recombinase family protein [Shewanella xiamenensis]MDH0451071.1 YqaJ viral recombinase family protein [Shewanella sp. GD04112]MDV5393095.1 YqaJ viral recombinase family protein [Shewanella xiamenensis]UWG66938.1 YqaJ viral recombinase family protein [Shewanella xiamenensis]
MKIIPLTQGSESWLEWRGNGLGASLAHTIIGASHYDTAYQLWGEIIGIFPKQDLDRNPNVIRGKQFEDTARAVYEKHTNEKFPPLCIESQLGYPFIASLDGLSVNSKKKRVLEIKCPAPSTWDELVERKRLSLAFRTYYTQVQYQLLCCDGEAESGVLFFYNVETRQSLAFEILPEPAFQDWLKEQVLKFWDLVINRTPPELDLERDCITPDLTNSINTKEWKELTYQLVNVLSDKKALETKVDALDKQKRAIEQSIIDLLGGFKQGECFGVKVAVSRRTGSIDYQTAYNDLAAMTGQSVPLTKRNDSFSTRLSINRAQGEAITKEVIESVRAELIKTVSSTPNDYDFTL